MTRGWLSLLFMVVVTACASTATVDDISLDASSLGGLFVKKVVVPETTDLVVVPVDLESSSFGKPIVLRGNGSGLVEAASNRSGKTRHLYYASHFLEPGDYAVLRMGANLSQANLDIKNTFCYANFSAVVSVEPGTVSLWDVMPIAIRSWESYSSLMLADGRENKEALNYANSTADLPNFHPTSVKVAPSAFVRFETQDPKNPWKCSPVSMTVEHIVE